MTRENLITAAHFFKAFEMPQQILENAQRFNHKFSKDFFVAYSATPQKKQERWVVPTWRAGHMQVHIAYNPYFKLLLILVVVSVSVVVLFERCTTLYVIAIK